jgi:hypothetical protein
MTALLDAFWRAAAYCLHPRVILLSLLPLAVAGGAAWLLGWLYWEAAIDAVRATLQAWSLTAAFMTWLTAVGAGGFAGVLPLMILIALAVPVIVVVSLLLVAFCMTPALTRLVASRRFPSLERRRGGSWWAGLGVSVGCTVLAVGALVLSIPLWFIPPLVLVIPPLIWGWLSYRVMSFDVLGEHASADERRRVMAAHRWPLLAVGVVTGYLGAVPSLVWAVTAAMVLFPLLVLASVWLYTLVFAFSSLWFAHYALAALQRLRTDDSRAAAAAAPSPAVPALPESPHP